MTSKASAAPAADRELKDIIGAVAAVAEKRAGAKKKPAKNAALFPRFVRQFYAGSPPDELNARTAEALCDAAAGAWDLFQNRKVGVPKISITNVGESTVIQIVNDDMPFLVSSISHELERVDLIATVLIHPVLTVKRDVDGELIELGAGNTTDATKDEAAESLMHIEINGHSDAETAERLRDNIKAVLSDVRLAVRDWAAMRRLTAHVAAEFEAPVAGVKPARTKEVTEFLHWLNGHHFTFLGYRLLKVSGAAKERKFNIEQQHSLGVLNKARLAIFDGVSDGAPVPAQFGEFLDSRNMLLILKANQRSTVHRRAHFDVVAVKIIDAKGVVTGLHLMVGLFTADVYNNSPNFVPVLRNKLDRIRERVGFRKHSHDDKMLQNVMEGLPRDELFETSDSQLMQTALGILHLQQRPRTAVFVRQDQFERFASVLVYVLRDRFDTALRVAIGDILVKSLDGRMSSFFTQVTDGPLARIHYIIATRTGKLSKVYAKAIEAQVAKAARSWNDDLRAALVKAHGERDGGHQADVYALAFPASYRERFDAETAVGDMAHMAAATESKQAGIHVYQPPGATGGTVCIKIYNASAALPLSDVMPVLEHMGFKVMDEEPFHITPLGGGGRVPVWLQNFSMVVATNAPIDIAKSRAAIEEAFRRVWAGEMESDGFNKLVALADLGWREVTILRAYAKYLRQAAFPFSQAYIENAFAAHPKVARLLVEMFLTSFDPALNGGTKAKAAGEKAAEIRADIVTALDAVSNADEDRILRRYLNLMDSTLRTNFFQKGADGNSKSYTSFKLNSRTVEDLPLPRMNVEVFVYAARVEAIHLRGGKVARGGIRWSDRREDFRSEVLGLVKAQMVKNAVIVPTGSKGGFVVKRPPTSGGREAYQAEGIECYKTLQRGLLDITDNIVNDKLVPPKDVVRKDGDDPYLVVAADKGTATFSDIANGVSAEYNFWLGDAYASGGSVGYDHKAMGITARGAWECVKRHFREMGVDSQAQDFTCVGVGDMSGDVFGNGMLMSKHIKLLAAFNHLHIFIDPDPADPAKCFAERERMFKLPRSNWTDYNAKLISKGGGIFERSAKSIKLSPEMKALLEINKAEATPAEIMNAILKAKVDLIFFGGIGTYVKSSAEANAEASDRANDAIRVNGGQLRAKVVGEGANLGMTQRGRIEAAKSGVRLNTDAIDNSAGVDCSDHEVNIKILLNVQMGMGKLTLANRNKLLAEMTEEVGLLVLRDNYQQSQTISMMQHRGVQLLDAQQRTMKLFEREGLLNREIEFLPSDEEIQERMAAGQGLTRPELAVFLPYGKMWLYDKMIASDLPDDPVTEQDLQDYFPTPLRNKYAEAISRHKLRREIIGTVLTNNFINRVGPSFLTTLMERTGLGAVDVARAYTVSEAAYGLRDIWSAIEALDNKVPAAVQMEMLLEVARMLERSVLWLLRNVPTPMNMTQEIKALKPGVDALRKALTTVWSDEVAAYIKRQADNFQKKGVPAKLAFDVASIYRLAAANEITTIAASTKQTVAEAARIYYLVGERFGLGALRARTENFATGSHWDKLAVSAAIEELFGHQRNLARTVTAAAKGKLSPEKALEAWVAGNKARIERYDQVFAEVRAAESLSLSMLTVANRQLSAMTAG